MTINKIEIQRLYGYLSKEILFPKDVALLVGINGSGKTSILNIINWMLKPALSILCVTEFDMLRLLINVDNKSFTITCKHLEKKLQYDLENENEIFHPLLVPIKVPPQELRNNDELKEALMAEYTMMTPDAQERPTWNLLESFPNPTIIGLDRNLYTEEGEDIYSETRIRRKVARKAAPTNLSPLTRVKEIVNTEYRKRKNEVLNLTNALKNQLMFSTFNESLTIESFTAGIKHKLNISQIDAVKTRVFEYLEKFEKNTFSPDEQKIVSKYFSQLHEIVRNYQDSPNDETTKLLYGLNATQFIKINKLLREFEKYEGASSSAMKHINNFLSTLNYFLKDSSKQLIFKEDTSELTFHILDKKSNVVSFYNDVNFLSSGEQQILILFSYIAFNNRDGRIFLIDEPELSLHIKWQEEFLQNLELITPKTTQLIIATHSPILAAKKPDRAQVLYPYNQ